MKTSPDFLVALAERLGWALLHSLWQGALIAIVLAVALRLMRGRRAAARHALCLLALLALVASVAGTAWLVRPTAQVSRFATTLPNAALESAFLPAAERVAADSPAMPAVSAPTASWRERFEPLLPLLSAVWIAGVALLSLRHLVGWRRLSALRRQGVSARAELQESFVRLLEKFGHTAGVRLLESADAAVPMLTGLFKPVVLLPMSVISGLSAREIEAILAHELAHFARHDAWSNLAQVAIETLLFYHPAVWWIGRRTREEREIAADDLALEVCADRRVYATALAHLAELHFAPQAGLAATGGSLLARIQRIVRPVPIATPVSGWSVGVPVLFTALALAAFLRTQADETKPAAAPNEIVQKAAPDPKAWLADAFQLDDKAKREAAIERVRAAMTSSDADEARAGVTTFVQLGPIEFDKASFRPAVRALLASTDAPTRAAAASAFTMTGADADDLLRIFALADDPDPEVRDGLTYVIVQLTKHDLRDKAASEAILKLMANLPRDSRSVAHSMWGVKFSPEIEARVLEFCRDITAASNSSVGYNFFYGSLSTQANKSEASCKRLIELLAHPDTTNIAGRSAWGLQQGVDRAQFPLVADAMVKVIEARSGGYLRNNALRNLRSYGNAAHAPALKALLAKPGATGDMRKDFEETLASIEARPAAHQFGLGAKADQAEGFAESSRVIPADTLRIANAMVRASGPTEMPTIEVEWNGKWWPASVIEEKDGKTQIHYVGYGKEWDEWVTKERIRSLTPPSRETPRVNVEEMVKHLEIERRVEKNRQAARLRAGEDKQRYTFEQLGEIETLYQVANTKGKRSPEAKESLKQLLEKYGEANRTGCATLYLGQASEGAERLEYLTRAVEKFSDCYYFNGCQVGGYGRFVLALTLWEKGEKEKARVLFGELKTTYKEATDHNGRPMGEVAEAVEKELTAK